MTPNKKFQNTLKKLNNCHNTNSNKSWSYLGHVFRFIIHYNNNEGRVKFFRIKWGFPNECFWAFRIDFFLLFFFFWKSGDHIFSNIIQDNHIFSNIIQENDAKILKLQNEKEYYQLINISNNCRKYSSGIAE